MEFLSILSYLLIYIILPIAGIVALIFLAILFNNSAQTIKKFDDIADDISKRLKVVDNLIDTIVNFKKSFVSLADFFKSFKETASTKKEGE
ncbi:uncharacterized protein YoxC [Bacilli bacterium PM5-3]|nr:uncharacterized protein YoxC [Bacilli bacterium PM5-3]MDH6603588.1 uncharacterized protein YoxC [Bacilli bacterium PM5-9]